MSKHSKADQRAAYEHLVREQPTNTRGTLFPPSCDEIIDALRFAGGWYAREAEKLDRVKERRDDVRG